MRATIITGATAMLIITVIVANLSMVRPRPKPELPVEVPPVEQVITAAPQNPPPVVLLEKQAARLKQVERALKEQTVQAQRIDQKLDAFIKVEEAKDARGQ